MIAGLLLLTLIAVSHGLYINSDSPRSQPFSGACLCHNGGMCLQTGICVCTYPYVGAKCEIETTDNRIRKRSTEAGKCLPPTDPDHGKAHFESNALIAGAAVKYRCDPGYTMIGSATRHCQEGGSLTGERPTCDMLCSFPPLTQREGLTYAENPGQLGEPLRDTAGNVILHEIAFNCSNGFTMSGSPKIRCLGEGKWDQLPPTCGKGGATVCANFDSVANGRSNLASSTTYQLGTVATFSCDSGFRMEGTAMIVCTASGSWTPSPPKCVPKDVIEEPSETGRCPRPQSFDHGTYVSFTQPDSDTKQSKHTFAEDTDANFKCDQFYESEDGRDSRKCLLTGTWSGKDPVCKPVCGRGIQPKVPHIIGGAVAERHAFPWQAALSYLKSSDTLAFRRIECGAVLLRDRWAVTAAHCVTEEKSTVLRPTSDFLLLFGKHYYSRNMDKNDVDSSKIVQIIVRHDYEPLGYDNDIALLNLETPIKFTAKILPVCLPSSFSTLEIGKPGIVSGWGYTNQNRTAATELMMTILPVVNSEQCEKNYRPIDFKIQVTENMFCAGFDQGGTNVCKGDSGGPFVVEENEHYTLEGIVSWGNSGDCAAPGFYGAFVRVSKFVNWIRSYIEK